MHIFSFQPLIRSKFTSHPFEVSKQEKDIKKMLLLFYMSYFVLPLCIFVWDRFYFWINQQIQNYPHCSHEKNNNQIKEVPLKIWVHRVVSNNNPTVRPAVWLNNTVLEHHSYLLLTIITIPLSATYENLQPLLVISAIEKNHGGGVCSKLSPSRLWNCQKRLVTN